MSLFGCSAVVLPILDPPDSIALDCDEEELNKSKKNTAVMYFK